MHSLNALIRGGLTAVAMMVLVTSVAGAETLRIPVGRAQVVESPSPVTTVAIAEPEIADAAVGSERTVVVNGKKAGKTSLVVYNEGGRYTLYDVDVYTPNGGKQVLLRVRVAEMDSNARKELGFDWFGAGQSNVPWLDGAISGGLYTTKVASPSAPLSIGPATDGFLGYTKNGNEWSLQTTWRALEEEGALKTLANPTLVARSGEKASFLAGGEFPVPIASGAGANGQTTVTIEWKEFGVKVDFTPTVMEDNRISLKVAPEVSALDFTITQIVPLSGFTVPALITRRTETTVDMNEREFLVIGGLKDETDIKTVKKVPVLGDIPLLGFFFRNTVTEKQERELMVIVSPELITPSTGALPQLEMEAEASTDGTN